MRQIDGALAVQFKFRRGAARIGHGNNALVTGERDQNLFKSSTGRGQLFNFFKALRSTAQKSGQPFEVLCDGRKIRQFKLQRRDGDAALSVQGSGDIGSVEPQPGVDASLSGNLFGAERVKFGQRFHKLTQLNILRADLQAHVCLAQAPPAGGQRGNRGQNNVHSGLCLTAPGREGERIDAVGTLISADACLDIFQMQIFP